VVGHLLDGHDGTEIVDVLSQAPGHSRIGGETFQIFDANTLAGGAEYFAIPTMEKDSLVGKAQIPDDSLLPIVDRRPKGGAFVADGTVPHIWYGRDVGGPFFLHDSLLQQFESTEGKIRCYSKLGHRESPFWMCDYYNHNIHKDFPHVPCFLHPFLTH